MTISFTGYTNKSYFMCDGVMFELSSGEIVAIASDSVSYYITDDDEIEFSLVGVYFIDLTDVDEDGWHAITRYMIPGDEKMFLDAEVVGVYIDEDAVDDYELDISEFRI